LKVEKKKYKSFEKGGKKKWATPAHDKKPSKISKKESA